MSPHTYKVNDDLDDFIWNEAEKAYNRKQKQVRIDEMQWPYGHRPKCECGLNSTGEYETGHSSWCPLADK